ncbi:MAG: PilZ domain-containing protein [Myxococcota bacterium]
MLPAHPVMVWTDDRYDVGDELDLDVFPGDGTTLEFVGRVEWVQDMPDEKPAAYRVGIRLSSKSVEHRDLLAKLLE